MRSSANLRPQEGHSERSSRGFDANSDLRVAAAGCVDDEEDCKQVRVRLTFQIFGLRFGSVTFKPLTAYSQFSVI